MSPSVERPATERPRATVSWRPTPFLRGSAALHAAGALALAAAPGRWPWVAGALVANHAAICAAGLLPRSGLLGPVLTRLPEAAARRGEVALTFDDGPDPEVTPRVLDLLDRRGARASFFCIGRRAAACPELVAEAAARGHRVENHTHRHPNGFALYFPAALRREIGESQEALARAAGRPPALFRPPAGFRNPFLDPALAAAGLALATWTRRGFDAVARDPGAILRRLLRGLAPGDVLLLHDGSTRRGGGPGVVLEVLPRLLDALAARGLTAVPFAPPDAAEGRS